MTKITIDNFTDYQKARLLWNQLSLIHRYSNSNLPFQFIDYEETLHELGYIRHFITLGTPSYIKAHITLRGLWFLHTFKLVKV